MPLTAEERRAVDQYVSEWWAAVADRRGDDWKDRLPDPPVVLMQRAALHHPNGKVRRFALGVLDHAANDASTEVFRAALRDPAPVVRLNALHGLSCERCRVGELCTDDIVPALLDVLEHDASPKVRHASLFPLILMSSRDARVQPAFARAARHDPDPLLRLAAAEAAAGNYKRVKTRKALRRRVAGGEAQVRVGGLGEAGRAV
ncbi:MAG TPA: HEAT repeat domain-containing protein [Acidimicrobiales bacterium]|nr:HEAT repeat domain-containing protein [Acidimicrobiales bacterium]